MGLLLFISDYSMFGILLSLHSCEANNYFGWALSTCELYFLVCKQYPSLTENAWHVMKHRSRLKLKPRFLRDSILASMYGFVSWHFLCFGNPFFSRNKNTENVFWFQECSNYCSPFHSASLLMSENLAVHYRHLGEHGFDLSGNVSSSSLHSWPALCFSLSHCCLHLLWFKISIKGFAASTANPIFQSQSKSLVFPVMFSFFVHSWNHFSLFM